MELITNDFINLMNGGISAMRQGIEERKILIVEFQTRVKEEYINFKKEMLLKSKEQIFMDNIKIYTIQNLFLFFCNHNSSELWDFMSLNCLGTDLEIKEEEIIEFFKTENILHKLYDFEINYDAESHTDTWENICQMISEFIYERRDI